MAAGTRLGKWTFFGVIGGIALFFCGALAMPLLQRNRVNPEREYAETTVHDFIHPVAIRRPDGPPMVDSGKKDHHGQPVMVACATCHDTREPDFKTVDADSLDEFHQGLKYQHGGQSCLSCHNAGDYGTLKHADGRALDYTDSMQLCAQCHGPQYRDYQNGSHGGMTGYWDLKRGPRQRNHCIDCHDPHSPAYPQVKPVFPPKPIIGEAVHSSGAHSKH